MDDPFFLLMGMSMAGYFVWLWRADFLLNRVNPANAKGALPGAFPASFTSIAIGMAGAALLVGLETWGEIRLGIVGEQSEITVLFALYSVLGAGIVEELVFRGYGVINSKGRGWLIAGAVGASILFAVVHQHLWKWEDGVLTWHFDTKGWFSTAALFITSLWFYACRFAPWNRTQSLLPCFAAHAAKNLCVVAVKAAQGFVIGLW